MYRAWIIPLLMVSAELLTACKSGDSSSSTSFFRIRFSRRVSTPPSPVPTPTPAPSNPANSNNPSDAQLPPVDMTGPIGGSRPVAVQSPVDLRSDGGKRYPLLILLHGFNSDGKSQDAYLDLSRRALAQDYFFIAPNGTPTVNNNPYIDVVKLLTTRFWNASKSCCNFTNQSVDDIAYIRDLIRQMIARYPIDPKRVYLFGHSNGAFMAHRFACAESERVAGIAALAGSLGSEINECQPKVPVATLTIHGTMDPIIRFEGGLAFPTAQRHPGALQTISQWARLNRCESNGKLGDPFSLLDGSSTLETRPISFDGCAQGGAAQLWMITGGTHVPRFNNDFVPKVLDFFAQHKRL